MLDLKQSKFKRSILVNAWRDHATYDSAALYNSHLAERLHQDAGQSTKLAEEYLDQVDMLLRAAHQQHSETMGTLAKSSAAGPSTVHTLCTTWQRGAGKKSSMSISAHSASSRGGQPKALKTKGQGVAKGLKGKGKQSSLGKEVSRKMVLSLGPLLNKRGTQGYKPPQLRDLDPRLAGTGPRNWEEAKQAIRQGHCMICLEPGHRYKECGFITNPQHPAHQKAVEFLSLYGQQVK